MSVLRLLAIIGLLMAFSSGWEAAAGRLDAGAHTAAALAAGALSVVAHIRSRTGYDLVSTLLLVLVVGLGTLVSGGAVSGQAHLAVAAPAVALSGAVHAARLWRELRT